MSPRFPCREAEVILGLSRPLCCEFSRASSTEFPGASESLFPATGLCRPLSINIISFLIRSIIKPRKDEGEEEEGERGAEKNNNNPHNTRPGGLEHQWVVSELNPRATQQVPLNNCLLKRFYKQDAQKTKESECNRRATAQNVARILPAAAKNVIHQKWPRFVVKMLGWRRSNDHLL